MACGNFAVEEGCVKDLVGISDGERVFGERTRMLDEHIINIREICLNCLT